MQPFLPVLLLLFALTPVEPHLRIFNLRATDLPADIFGVTDGYVKLFLNGVQLGQTAVVDNKANPVWEEEFEMRFVTETDALRVEVHDSDYWYDDLVGACQEHLQHGVHQKVCKLQHGGQLLYTYSLKEIGEEETEMGAGRSD